MKKVYLDRHQCERFDVPYMFSDGELVIHANTLLESKWSGYDQEHTDYLQGLGHGYVHLVRNDNDDSPGWFRVTDTRVTPR